jgi:hypothetical protein
VPLVGAPNTEEIAEMKYMLMMQATATQWQAFGGWPEADLHAHIGFMKKLNQELKASGELVDAQGLTMPSEARIIRATSTGAPAVTDGPFPESKEFLAGYWIVDLRSHERMLELAAFISAAPGPGGVPMNMPIEVRPIGEAPNGEPCA